MLRTILSFTLLAVGYAAFAALFRNKSCSGNCGACGSGSCELKEHHK
jgi:hypothetical protein